MNRSLVSIPVLFFLFFAVGLALYHSGLFAPFFYDSTLVDEKAYAYSTYGFSDLLKLFQSRRPIPNLTFYLNHVLTGADPYYFRVFNVAILAAGSVLVTLFALLLLGIPAQRSAGTDNEKKTVSVLLGLLFLTHPLQIFVVLFVWQRMALLACFFYLASIVLYLAARTDKFQCPILGYGLSAFFFVCAILSKESAVALIPTIVVMEGAFLSKSPKVFRQRVGLLAICLSVAGGIAWIILKSHSPGRISSGMLGTIAGYYRESGLIKYIDPKLIK